MTALRMLYYLFIHKIQNDGSHNTWYWKAGTKNAVLTKKVRLANKADSGDDKLEVAIVRQQKGGD